jgi:hypothetical protein
MPFICIQFKYNIKRKTTTKITFKFHSAHRSFITHHKAIHNVGT